MTKLYQLFALVFAALAIPACASYKTPEQKAGYSVGLKIGKDLAQIKDKVDAKELVKGMQDQLAGKAAMDAQAMQAALQGLQSGADKAKAGYAVGVNIGQNIGRIKNFIDAGSCAGGIQDQMAGKKPKLDEAAQNAALEEMGKREQEERMAQGGKNLAEGKAWLEANKAKPGVKTTSSGLQYLVQSQGQGRRPKATSTVSVHYTGTLTDGTKFDSSVDRGMPAEFPLNGVIRGWTEGLQLMAEGAKYRFFIPADLGYGANGQGAIIGPNMPLVFDVELLKIVKY